ncbi:MAG: hypothetical protein COB68_14180, partial [SAR202 cluster bacterium]
CCRRPGPRGIHDVDFAWENDSRTSGGAIQLNDSEATITNSTFLLNEAGFGEHKLNACGYSLGALYPPTWMDWPMIYAGNPVVLEPNMVIFMHMILLDWERRLAMSLGDTVVVTPNGCETLTKMRTDLIVN